MAIEPGQLPVEHLPELKAFLRHLLAKEAAVRGAAVLPHEALGEHARRVLYEPGKGWVTAGQAPLNAALQRQQVDPEDPLPTLTPDSTTPLLSCSWAAGA